MIWTMTAMAFGLLFLGLPLWLIFLATSVVVIYFFTSISMQVVSSTLFGSLDSFILLAVPGFIFAGEVMARGGMTLRMIRWLRSLVGPIPGGLPLTVLGAGELFGAISGSSAASTAALGKVLYPALREQGYSDRFGLGLIASSGAIAIIIPPSITMILYSSVTSASLGKLFLAGFVPGIVLGALVGVYSIYQSYRQGIVGTDRWAWKEIWGSTKDAIWTLGMPLIIFGGIYGGFITPTEAAAVACVYALLVSGLIYRELDLKTLWTVTLESARLTAKIFLITAAAGLFSWVLTIAQVPQDLARGIEAMGLQPWAVLVMINILLLLAGMFIDPVSNVLVLTPILWPIAQTVGINEIHFGIIMVVNMAIGMFSPPFGLNIFVASSIFNVSTTRIVRGLVPFFWLYLIGLILVTYIPDLSLWLPELLGM